MVIQFQNQAINHSSSVRHVPFFVCIIEDSSYHSLTSSDDSRVSGSLPPLFSFSPSFPFRLRQSFIKAIRASYSAGIFSWDCTVPLLVTSSYFLQKWNFFLSPYQLNILEFNVQTTEGCVVFLEEGWAATCKKWSCNCYQSPCTMILFP